MDRLYIPAIILRLKKIFYCNDKKITKFQITESKTSSTAYVVVYELIDSWVLDSTRKVRVDYSHGAGRSSPSCRLDDVFVPVQKLCVNIYLYTRMNSLYEF